MVKTVYRISKPTNFNFQRTVKSHGWYSLLPFELDEDNWILRRVLTLEDNSPITVEIQDAEEEIQIFTAESLSAANATQIMFDVRRLLRLDEDFTEFYELVKDESEFAWIATRGAGRLLRSPTVFEDLVKSICTTNCSWALTKIMTTNLVQKLGEPTSDNLRRSFPSAEAMAKQTSEFYQTEIRAGYRSGYLKELAERIASGELNVESWLTSDLSADELKKQIKRVKGVGDYAAENLFKLLGRYDGLALDSWLRMRFAQKHNDHQKCADENIHQYYKHFGKWRGLALWCDMTEDWL